MIGRRREQCWKWPLRICFTQNQSLKSAKLIFLRHVILLLGTLELMANNVLHFGA